jgi:uncharacterized protein YndB with AHSA1/START domain
LHQRLLQEREYSFADDIWQLHRKDVASTRNQVRLDPWHEPGRPFQWLVRVVDPFPVADHHGYSPDRSSVWVDGEVLEVDPPNRLVHTWLARYEPEMAEEQPSRVTWEIEDRGGGMCLLTVVHDQLEGAPKTAQSVSGQGWMYVLSGLKTLLETGESLPAFSE